MKIKIYKNFKQSTLFLLLTCSSYILQAQIAAWDFNGLNTVATATATIFDANLVSASSANLITRGSGATASAGNNSFRTVGFQNNGIAVTNTDYFQITLTAAVGHTLSLSTIDARFAGTGTYAASPGVSNQFAYSLDGTNFTLIGTPTITIATPVIMPQISLTGISALQNVVSGTTVTLRYYASGQTATGGWGFNSPAVGNYGLAIGGSLALVSTCTIPGVPQCVTPNAVCVGNSATIVGSGSSPAATTYTYWNASSGGTQLTAGVVGNDLTTSTSLSAGTYPFYVQGENGTCVSATRQQVNVVVNDAPVATVSGGGNACGSNAAPNVSISFTGASPFDFSYSDGTTSTPIIGNTANPFEIVNPNAGTYTVISVTGAGCTGTSTGSAVVTNSALPTVTASALPLFICANETSTLTANGASTYEWQPGSLTGNSILVTSSVNSYTVTGTDAIGCSNSTVVSFVVNALPIIGAAASDTTICENTSTSLIGSGAVDYSWMPGNMTASPTVTPISTTTYTVTGTDANNCVNSSTIEIIVNTPISVTASASPAIICNGQSSTLSASGSGNYTWMPGNLTASPIVSPSSTQTYTVSSIDANGCEATDTVSITVNQGTNLVLAPDGSCYFFSSHLGLNVFQTPQCELLGSINSTGNLGATEMCVDVTTNNSYNGEAYADRVYKISVANNNIPSTVCLNYTAADLLSAGISNNSEICITKISGDGLPGLGAASEIPNASMTITASTFGTEVCFPVTSFSGFYCHSCNPNNAVLPVVIAEFTGKKENDTHLLTWVTSSENNNAHFIVMHSTDGIHFNAIGTLNSKAILGNSTEKLTYSFVNQTPRYGHNYYQLQQVDLDGKKTLYSKVIDLETMVASNSAVVFPNPITDKVNIELYVTKSQQAKVKLIDMTGRVILELNERVIDGLNHIQMSTQELASGLYQLQIFDQSKMIQQIKLIKQ